MCVVSMIMDHYYDGWSQRWPKPVGPYEAPYPYQPNTYPRPTTPQYPSQFELDEFRQLLKRAREYDRRNNEPHCEMKEKQERLLALAKQLGIDIAFVVDDPNAPKGDGNGSAAD